MRILSATKTVGGHVAVVAVGQQKKDMMILQKMHSKSLKSDPTWGFFGGTLRVGNRVYQVVD